LEFEVQLKARNKHFVLKILHKEQKEEKKVEFFGASPKKIENVAYTVIDRAADCTIAVGIGDTIIVDGNMVQENIFDNQVFLTCKENFIIGVLED
jgi:flavin-binding protein dodecin